MQSFSDRSSHLTGRHVILRPVMPADYDSLRMLELSGSMMPNWRHRGVTPSPEQWAHMLWQSVLAQFIVVETAGDTAIGLVVAYGADSDSGFAYVAATKFDLTRKDPYFLSGLGVFIDYLFTFFSLRKLYFETFDMNLEAFASSVGSLLEQEGRLVNHAYFDGRHLDLSILALYRDRWMEWMDKYRAFL